MHAYIIPCLNVMILPILFTACPIYSLYSYMELELTYLNLYRYIFECVYMCSPPPPRGFQFSNTFAPPLTSNPGSALGNDIKCKYMFMSPLKNLALKELNGILECIADIVYMIMSIFIVIFFVTIKHYFIQIPSVVVQMVVIHFEWLLGCCKCLFYMTAIVQVHCRYWSNNHHHYQRRSHPVCHRFHLCYRYYNVIFQGVVLEKIHCRFTCYPTH